MTTFANSRSSSHRGSWMYTDPYAYQYSDLDPEDEFIAPVQQGAAAGSAPMIANRSIPTNEVCFELEGDSPTETARNRHHVRNCMSTPCGVRRSNFPMRDGRRYSNHRESPVDGPVQKPPGSYAGPRRQPSSSGLIPVLEDTCPTVLRVPRKSHTYPGSYTPVCEDGLMPVCEDDRAPTMESHRTFVQHRARDPLTTQSYTRQSQQAYNDGLMLQDESPSTSKEPADFDTILKNIGSISKKGKGVWRERGSRYYDRFSSNFG
ncbi:hypothetical protein GGR50DRAFT_514910 [Xylaria sp. CBS 124048]|nr:hypothetical protein GGR50DRAFT_514910 [Xylaria sp. CBS 124048]